MSAFEDGQPEEQPLQPTTTNTIHQQLNSPIIKNDEENESCPATNNNSIMGKVKLRVSSILPDSLSKWFSPSEANDTQQHNGNAAGVTGTGEAGVNNNNNRKRSRRRIELETADAAEGFNVDDGADAEGLNYEEVALADNIAEHDLVAEDEQTRRNEYNVNLMRKLSYSGGAGAGGGGGNEDDDDDDDEEDDDEDEERNNAIGGAAPARYRTSFDFNKHWGAEKNVKAGGLPAPKRKRLLDNLEQDSPISDAWRRRSQFLASTPATGVGGSKPLTRRNRNAPNRLGYMNMYGQNRQPGYNFEQSTAGEEPAKLTLNDVTATRSMDAANKTGLSLRRSLNIPMSDRSGYPNLPKYRRQALSTALGRSRAVPWRSSTTINEGNEDEASNDDQLINSDAKRNNNNNNNVFNVKRAAGCFGRAEAGGVGSAGTDSYSECGSVESQPHGDLALSHAKTGSYNNNLDFYGNLQSRKSIFNISSIPEERSAAHYNSTLSLNSLSRRRRFNASIYGSTSALSDSRLLTSSISPFYQGRTAYGGSAANSRFLSSKFDAPQQSTATVSNNNNNNNNNNSNPSFLKSTDTSGLSPRSANYGLQPTEMRPNSSLAGGGGGGGGGGLDTTITPLQNSTGLSNTARRILNLLDNYSTPLIDANKMGSTLREHQQQRNATRAQQGQLPYARPIAQEEATSDSLPAETLASELLVPTMQQLIERRRLNRVTQSSRKLMFAKMVKQSSARPDYELMVKGANDGAAAINNSNADNAPQPELRQSHTHTNKLRTRLPHQTRKEAYNEERDQPLPVHLPNITFPAMSSTPKFDLVIPMPKQHATVSKAQAASRSNYQFEVPQILDSSNSRRLPSAVPLRSHNFVFSPPIPLDKPTSTTSLSSNSSTQQKPAAPAEQPSSSKSTGFSDLYKKAANQWECEACMLFNPMSMDKCVACMTPKRAAAQSKLPASAPANQATAVGFGDRFKKPANSWECEACMLANKPEAAKCVACETPRKSGTTVPNTQSSSNSSILSSCSSSSSTFKVTNTFGDAFKPKANSWECSSCMIVNQQSSAECVACQTRNPQASSSSSSSISKSSSNITTGSFKFGFAKPDSSFQQLAVTQKATSWECDACMAQNDVSRNKCICCEQLKPGSSDTGGIAAPTKFSFGTSSMPKSAGQFKFGFSAAAPTAAADAPLATTQATKVPTFMGFAAAKTGTDLLDTSKSKAKQAPQMGFSFEASATTAQKFPHLGAAVNATGSPLAAGLDTKEAENSTKPAGNLFNFALTNSSVLATTTTTTAAAAVPAPTTFTFGAPAPISTAATKTVDTKAAGAAAAAVGNPAAASTNLFIFGSGASSTVSSSTPSFGASKPTIQTSDIGFFAKETAAPPPPLVSTTATTTPISTLNFGADTTTTAAKSVPSTMVSSTTQPARTIFGQFSSPFVFGSGGNQSAATAAPKPADTAPSAPPAVAMPFLFGQPAATMSKSACNTSFNSIFGNPASATCSMSSTSMPDGKMSLGGASASATTTDKINDVAATPALPFTFGAKPAEPAAATTAAAASAAAAAAPAPISSASTGFVFSWPTAASNGITTNTAVSSSGGSISAYAYGSTNSTSTNSNVVSSNAAMPMASSPFGAPPAAGNGALTSIFGAAANAATAASPAMPMSSTPTAIKPFGGFGSIGGGTAGGAGGSISSSTPAVTTTQSNPVFNFGSSVATSTTYPTIGSFNFSMATSAAGSSTPKPAFNFTASQATGQSTTFNFTANAANSTTNASAGDSSTTNAAPFQFSAGASAPVNIFAFNPPAGGNAAQNAQMMRRKTRAPMRRLPPR